MILNEMMSTLKFKPTFVLSVIVPQFLMHTEKSLMRSTLGLLFVQALGLAQLGRLLFSQAQC